MTVYFSPTGGFQTREIHGDNIVAGALELDDDYHAALIAGQRGGNGITLTIDAVSGRPVLTMPAEKTINAARVSKMREVNESFEFAVATLRENYPQSEVISWAKQETEARSLIASPADAPAPTPLLSALALSRNTTALEIAAKIIRKSDIFAAAFGALLGARQQLGAKILSASTTAEVAAINWVTI